MEILEVLVFQALEIPYTLNLNQITKYILVGTITISVVLDFLQKSIMVCRQFILEYQILNILMEYLFLNWNSIVIVFSVDCATVINGQSGFCNCNRCSENEGDCDSHDECQDGFVCGSNNCPALLTFDSETDCCYQPTVGDEDFCQYQSTCGLEEGDCDSNNECQGGLFCGYNNCPVSHGFDTEVDCCSNIQIMSPNYPNLYPSETEETWLITAPNGTIIKLQFHSFYVRLIVIVHMYMEYYKLLR